MKEGDIVRINYTGKIKESDEIFDTTDEDVAEEEGIENPQINYGSVPVILGTEGLVEGLDEALTEMEVGEERTVKIPPEKAFGARKSELITTISEKKLKDQDINPRPGMTLNMGNREAKILSVNSGRVRLDMNHPLAGKDLVYDAKVESKVEGKKDKISAVAEFYIGMKPEVEMTEEKAIIKVDREIPERAQGDIREKINEHVGDVEVDFSVKNE